MSVATKVKAIQDIMRKDVGVDGDAQRISQLVWMLFLKIFDDKEQESALLHDDYAYVLPKRLQWSTWAANPEGMTGDELLDFVNNDLFRSLKNLSVTANSSPRTLVVREVFLDAYNYMKSGTLMRQVINKINEIDFNRQEDRHLFGDIYEKILKDLQSAGNAGEYYTPRAVTGFMVEMVNPQPGERILDPACGTGGLLACTIDHLRTKNKLSVKQQAALERDIRGVEKKPMPHLLCVTNMMLHGIDAPRNVRLDNTLSRPLRDYTPKDRVDVVVTNPPFGGIEEDGIEANFPAQFRTRETADLFLVLIMHLLKDGGRAALVLPDGSLFGEGVKTRIKEDLLKKCNLHTIVRLPNGVFNPYTGIKTNLLFFEKGKPTKHVWYYEHPYPEGCKSYSKTKPIRLEEFEAERKWWTKRKESELAWKVPVRQIIENGYNLDIKNPHQVDDDHGDPVHLLREYQQLQADIQETRNALRDELIAALGGKKE